MRTVVTRKNCVTIPAEVRRQMGIKPGWKLDWQPVEGKDEILVRVLPGRGELARHLLSPAEEEELTEAVEQIDRGEYIGGQALLDDLRARSLG